MPRTGSKLNDSLNLISKALVVEYKRRDDLRTTLLQARGLIDEIDKRIEGYERAFEILQDASNTI